MKDILNTSNFDNYMYPSRYNDTREMTRFFSFIFIDESEVTPNTNSYDLLFVKLPRAFHYRVGIVAGLAENIEAAKGCYDGIMSKLKRLLIKKTKTIFLLPQNKHNKKLISMTATMQILNIRD